MNVPGYCEKVVIQRYVETDQSAGENDAHLSAQNHSANVWAHP